jgi:lipoprotein YgeR
MRYVHWLVFIIGLLTCSGLAAETVHVVQRGENLYRIARNYRVPMEAVVSANHIQDPTTLLVGTELVIPDVYVVQRGDTLYGIAREHGMTLERLRQLNDLEEDYLLRQNDRLYIPVTRREIPTTPTQKVSQDPQDLVRSTSYYWPHPGTRLSLRGTLPGTVIQGHEGEPVVSVSSGTVVWVGPWRGWGGVIIVESLVGYTYVYGGNEETLVHVGDKVSPGTEIGVLGAHSREREPQLYFLVFKEGRPVDSTTAPRG